MRFCNSAVARLVLGRRAARLQSAAMVIEDASASMRDSLVINVRNTLLIFNRLSIVFYRDT